MQSKIRTFNLTWQPTVIIIGLAIILGIISSIWPETKNINTHVWCYVTGAMLLLEAGVGLVEQLSPPKSSSRPPEAT